MQVQERLKHNYSVIIFPEGTRYLDGVGNFKSGVMHIINRQPEAHLLPVTINGTKNVHRSGWLKFESAKVKVVFHKPILIQKKDNFSKEKNNILNKVEKIIKSKFENNY